MSDLAAEVARIRSQLEPLGDAERARGAKAYLKSDLEFLGLATQPLRRAAREYLKAHEAACRPGSRRSLVRALWRTRVHELWAFGLELLLARPATLGVDDLPLLEWMLRRAQSWAYVDAIAVHLVGALAMREPAVASVLDRWVEDDDFWLRRSALLALLLPLRRGGGDWPRFARYADALLDEREFFIRKAIGWVLREVGKKRPRLVGDFLAARLDRASGLTVREAKRWLPPAERRRLGG